MGAYHSAAERNAAANNTANCYVPPDCKFNAFWGHWECGVNDDGRLQGVFDCQQSWWETLKEGEVINGEVPKPDNILVQFADVTKHIDDGGGKYFTDNLGQQRCLAEMGTNVVDDVISTSESFNPVTAATSTVTGFGVGMFKTAGHMILHQC